MNSTQFLEKVLTLRSRRLRGEPLALELTDLVEEARKMGDSSKSDGKYNAARGIYGELLQSASFGYESLSELDLPNSI